jgi:hypothetical protein
MISMEPWLGSYYCTKIDLTTGAAAAATAAAEEMIFITH